MHFISSLWIWSIQKIMTKIFIKNHKNLLTKSLYKNIYNTKRCISRNPFYRSNCDMSFIELNAYKWLVISIIAAALALTIFGLTLERMVVLWPNVITYIVLALVGATIGFVIYGLFKGFENTFLND